MGIRHKWIDISTKKTEKRPRSPEKMLNIASYQRNLNQNYDEMLPPISQQAITTKNPKPTHVSINNAILLCGNCAEKHK